ncbi:DUF2493 domain-containing protein [Bacillus subtilis]|uniref:DUF2493 domain-containing protein n=1 Tax=Bacillus subtilis TaxID=1423 RepID=UPI003CEEBFB6
MILIKVCIAGSRGFNDYDLLREALDKILKDYEGHEVQIVSGGAEGADRLGERYSQERGMSLKQFIPNWDDLGDLAGHRRNVEMAYYSDWVVCFWDGSSKGTRGMINASKRAGKVVHEIRY